MSIYKMRTEFGHHLKLIMLGVAVIFVVGAVWQFGAAPPPGMEGDQGGTTLATVGGIPITAQEFATRWNQTSEMARAQGVNSTLQLADYKSMLLMNMIDGRLVLLAATNMGVDISQDAVDELYDQKIADYLRRNRMLLVPKISREQDKLDPRDDSDYIAKLEEFGSSLDREEEKAKSAVSETGLKEEVARQGIAQKLKRDVGAVTRKELADSYSVYKVRQILVSTSSLPEAQARNKAEKILREARSGKDFATLAKQNSDDGTKSKGGEDQYSPSQLAEQVNSLAAITAQQRAQSAGVQPDQKTIERGQKLMLDDPVALAEQARQFGFLQWLSQRSALLNVARKLKPGQVSSIIPTDMGFFIIKLENVQPGAVPAMDKKALADRRNLIRSAKMMTQWVDVYDKTRKKTTIKVDDAEMAGFYHLSQAQSMMMSGQSKGANKELALATEQFKKASKRSGEAAVKYVQLLQQQGKIKEAREALYLLLEGSSVAVQGPNMRLWLADMLLQDTDPKTKEKNKERAVDQLAKASEAALVDQQVHMQIAEKYKQLGMPEKAAKEQAEADRIAEKMKARQQKEAAKTEKPAPKPENKKPGS